MDDALFWVWGAGRKTPPARQEAERVLGVGAGSFGAEWRSFLNGSRHTPLLADLAPDSVLRTRVLRRSAPMAPLSFGATSVQQFSGGVQLRCKNGSRLIRHLAVEDHGLWGLDPTMGARGSDEVLLFFGGDAVTLRTLPRYAAKFRDLRPHFGPNGAMYLMHCWAFADKGRLAGELSVLIDRPVYGGATVQWTRTQAIEGPTYVAEGRQVRRIPALPNAVLRFD